MALSNLMIGTAGEYLVAAQMNLNGWFASLTMKNYPMVDIIGKNEQTGKFIQVQVKTIHKDRTFLVGFSRVNRDKMDLTIQGPYVIVDLKDIKHPEYFIVPKQDLIDITYRTDDAYYKKKCANGHPNEKYPMAVNIKEVHGYKDRWDLL